MNKKLISEELKRLMIYGLNHKLKDWDSVFIQIYETFSDDRKWIINLLSQYNNEHAADIKNKILAHSL